MGKKLFTFALCLFISVGAALAQRTKCQVLSRKLGLVPQFRVLPSWLKAR